MTCMVDNINSVVCYFTKWSTIIANLPNLERLLYAWFKTTENFPNSREEVMIYVNGLVVLYLGNCYSDSFNLKANFYIIKNYLIYADKAPLCKVISSERKVQGDAEVNTSFSYDVGPPLVLFLNDTWKTNQKRSRAQNLTQDI